MKKLDPKSYKPLKYKILSLFSLLQSTQNIYPPDVAVDPAAGFGDPKPSRRDGAMAFARMAYVLAGTRTHAVMQALRYGRSRGETSVSAGSY